VKLLVFRQGTLIGNPKTLEERVYEFDGLGVFKKLREILGRERILRLEEKDCEVVASPFVVDKGVASEEVEQVGRTAETDDVVETRHKRCERFQLGLKKWPRGSRTGGSRSLKRLEAFQRLE
jgi:hypothetical protein